MGFAASPAPSSTVATRSTCRSPTVDSYLIEDGRICAQTIRYTVTFNDISQAPAVELTATGQTGAVVHSTTSWRAA